MKYLIFSLAFLSLLGCQRNSGDFWEDSKTAGRHVSRGFRSLGGKHGDSRQINSREEFLCFDEEMVPGYDLDYVPLQDQEMASGVSVNNFYDRTPRENPGDPRSSLPGIEAFKDPSNISGASSVFEVIHFDYNSNLLQGDSQIRAARNIANYLKSHPEIAVFICGHCDERGPEAYNLALGARRANTIRNFLIQEGANPNLLFTISYGKERPLLLGHNETAWAENRRVEFKLYQK